MKIIPAVLRYPIAITDLHAMAPLEAGAPGPLAQARRDLRNMLNQHNGTFRETDTIADDLARVVLQNQERYFKERADDAVTAERLRIFDALNKLIGVEMSVAGENPTQVAMVEYLVGNLQAIRDVVIPGPQNG